MKTLLLSILFFFAFSPSRAQGLVFSKTVSEDTVQPTKGPNMRKYSHLFLHLGFLTPHSNNHYQKYPNSYEIGFGWRVKRKITKSYSVGYSFGLQYRNFHLKNLLGYPGMDTLNVTSERFAQRGLNLDFFQRFNFGRRGNSPGKYFDLYVWGDFPVWSLYQYRFSAPGNLSSFSKNASFTLRGFDWSEKVLYGTGVRLGLGKNTFYGTYRMSRIFTEKSQLPQLSPVFVGYQRSF